MPVAKLLLHFAFISLFVVCQTVDAQDRSVTTPDPVIGKDGDTYDLFSTGKGIQVKSSQDSVSWKDQPWTLVASTVVCHL